jgi:hypothetical protein
LAAYAGPRLFAYYTGSIRLAAATRDAWQLIENDLNALKQKTVQTRNAIDGYIKEVL